jgi:hypothetical protein
MMSGDQFNLELPIWRPDGGKELLPLLRGNRDRWGNFVTCVRATLLASTGCLALWILFINIDTGPIIRALAKAVL